MLLADEARIGTLSAALPEDTPATRAAIGGLIAATEMRPRGLPRSSILIIRRIRSAVDVPVDPHTSRTDHTFERALQGQIDAAWRNAARPAAGPVPPDAAAVLFADEAEMVGCLVADVVAGTVRGHWWWERMLTRYRQPITVGAVLIAHPESAPAALHALAEQGLAVAALDTLRDDEAIGVLDVVAACHGVPELAAADRSRATAEPTAGQSSFGEPAVVARAASAPLPLPHWRLLVVALQLATEPAAAKGASFRATISGLTEQDAAPPERPTAAARTTATLKPVDDRPEASIDDGVVAGISTDPTPHGAPERRDVHAPSEPTASTRPAIDPGTGASAHLGSDRAREVDGDQRGTADDDGDPPSAAHSGQPTIGVGADQTPTEPTARADGVRPADATQRADAGEADSSGPAPRLSGDGALTAYGGVLYLVNLMTFLGLPSCFEQRWQLASRVGAWGTLETIARGLLPASTEVLSDPVWRALAQLDGREPGQVPHLDVAPPDSFRLPWSIDDEPPASAHWSVHRGTLLVWANDVIIAAVPRDDRRPSRQAAALLDEAGIHTGGLRRARASAAPLARMPTGHGIGGALERWSSLTVPFIRWRLAQGLGTSPREIAATLLRHPATIEVTRTHVDVTFALDSSSVPVRLSGLDRTPGWVPDFGRVVTFDFVDGTSPW